MKTISKLASSLTIAILAMLAMPASATLIHDNGTDTTNIGGYCSACGSVDTYTMFDDFTLSNSYNDMLLEWDASFYNILPTAGATTNVRVSLWNNANANQIWSQLFSWGDLTLLSTNSTSGSHANLTMSVLLSSVNLTAGTYWLSMSGDDMHFSTTATQTGAIQVHSSQLGTGYNPNHNLPMTFRLYEATNVPEPSTIFVVMLGLAGFLMRKVIK